MAHQLARAFQQAIWIGNLSAAKEPDVDVRFEGIDVGERRVRHTCRRMAVVQYLANIVAAVAHDTKPTLRDRPQFSGMRTDPGVNRRIALERAREAEELAHHSTPPGQKLKDRRVHQQAEVHSEIQRSMAGCSAKAGWA